MELLKVFVGDSAISGAVNKNTMVKGDLLLLDATTHAVATANSEAVVIAACNDKGVYVSAPITKAGIKYIKYQAYTPPVEAQGSVDILATPLLVAGETYTLGVQIKEDLRMGTYNKNTEILASYVVPSTAVITSTGTNYPFLKEMASTLAKGFSANPMTSAGSPYQLIKVTRNATGGTITGAAYAVVKGSRQVTLASHGRSAGDLVSLDGGIYMVESAPTTSVFTLDTAFQGDTKTLTSGTTVATGNGGFYASGTQPTSFSFNFIGVVQTMKNRYDQFRMVDFVIITPKGNSTGIFDVTPTTSTLPTGTYRQIRDLEEKAYTNSFPLINYREFPFEDFTLNATSGTQYATFTIAYTSGWGYNMMQSNQAEFLQTVVVAAPAALNSQFDATLGTANASNFATTWNVWNSAKYAFVDIVP
jgi:hypothetical protein